MSIPLLELKGFRPARSLAGRAVEKLRASALSAGLGRRARGTRRESNPADLDFGPGEVVGWVVPRSVAGEGAAGASRRRRLALALAGVARWDGHVAISGRERVRGEEPPSEQAGFALLGPEDFHAGPTLGEVAAAESVLFGVSDAMTAVERFAEAKLAAAGGGGRSMARADWRRWDRSARATTELLLALARPARVLVAYGFLGRLGRDDAATWAREAIERAARRDHLLIFIEESASALAPLFGASGSAAAGSSPDGEASKAATPGPGAGPLTRVILERPAASPHDLPMPASLERWRRIEARMPRPKGSGAADVPKLEGAVAQRAGGRRVLALVRSDRADVARGQLEFANADRVVVASASLADLDLLGG